jgi:hypothetical protein
MLAAAWLLLGIGMGLGLYDAAFGALGRIYGDKARKAITDITLIAGFASTVGWPLTSFGQDAIGWRGTCFAWAAAHIFDRPSAQHVLPAKDRAAAAGRRPSSMNVTPHVAQNTRGRSSAIDGRTTRHGGYAVSQRIRKRIEEAFGWIKTIAGQEKTSFRGRERVGWAFTFAAAAYNLVRLPKLIAEAG